MTAPENPSTPPLRLVKGGPSGMEKHEAQLKHNLAKVEEVLSDILFKLGSFYQRTGRPREAVPHFERHAAFAASAEDAAHAWLSLGQLMETADDFPAARTYYERGLALRAGSRQTRFFLRNNLGYTLNQLGHHAEAEHLCRQAIEIDPERHNAHKNLGLAYQGQGRWREAVAKLLDAAELCPQDGRALAHAEELVGERKELAQDAGLAERIRECRALAEPSGDSDA